MRARAVGHLRRNVVAYVALFISLGGTATAATYVVSSNSQIGPGTVSGAKPPTGDHSNVIAGSIGPGDLATGAVTQAKIAANAVNSPRVLDNSLTGADINESSLAAVPNASALQGHPATDFTQGGGHVYGIHTSVDESGSGDVLVVPGLFTMYAFCGDTLQDNGQYGFQTSSESFTVYADNGGADPTSIFVGANSSAGSSYWASNPNAERFMFELDGVTHQATIVVFSQMRNNTFLHRTFCSYTGHAIVTP